MNRRLFLGAGLLGLAGCSASSTGSLPPTTSLTTPTSTTTSPSPEPSPATAVASLEEKYDTRIGVFAQVVGGEVGAGGVAGGRMVGGAAVAHRAAERFPMCSTFKVLAVTATLRAVGAGGLGERITYTDDDVLEYAPITAKHVRDGMTLGALCDAAIRYSDNTAANLLLARTGGPASVTLLAHTLGDPVTRLDRTEPELNTAIPGDLRDTTTPAAYAGDLRALLLGNGLKADEKRLLLGWMTRNTTGDKKIRAGVHAGGAVPKGWAVADKTGSGAYGTSNDVGLIRLPSGDAVVLAVFTTGRTADADPEPTLVAQVTASVLSDLRVS